MSKKNNGDQIDRVKERIAYVFRNNSDEYTQYDEKAMSEDKFVEVVSAMLAEREKERGV